MSKMKVNKTAILACCLVILVSLCLGCSRDKEKETKSKVSPTKAQKTQVAQIKKTAPPKKEKKVEKIEIYGKAAVLETEKGTIEMKFYPDDAPNTVRNFIKLANEGFYKDMNFHRVEPGFVIQTGDPTGTGYGGAGYNIKAEFNKQKHLVGTVAMARAGDDPDSANGQFYICLDELPYLDGKYTVFGQVTKGLDVIHKIEKGDKLIRIKIIDKE